MEAQWLAHIAHQKMMHQISQVVIAVDQGIVVGGTVLSKGALHTVEQCIRLIVGIGNRHQTNHTFKSHLRVLFFNSFHLFVHKRSG